MKQLPIVWDAGYSPVFPDSHRFPMAKFRLLKEWVDHHVPATELVIPTPCPIDILEETHDPNYVSDFQFGFLDAKVIREIGLPWSQGLRDRTNLALGGTIKTCDDKEEHQQIGRDGIVREPFDGGLHLSCSPEVDLLIGAWRSLLSDRIYSRSLDKVFSRGKANPLPG